MTTLAWSVRIKGGEPDAIRAAVENGVALLRGEQRVQGLSPDEQDYWREDVCAVSIGKLTAQPDGDLFCLVELTLDDITDGAPLKQIEAVLSGGFDTAVLDAVMDVEGVTQGTYRNLGEPPF